MELVPELVSELMIHTFLQSSVGPLDHLIGRIRKAHPAARITILGTPPPKGDNGWIRSNLGPDSYFAILAKRMNCDVRSIPLPDPFLRLKLWSVIQSLYREFAETKTCRFVPCPPAAQDEYGFLLRDLWGADATHANEKYGRLAYEHLKEKSPALAGPISRLN